MAAKKILVVTANPRLRELLVFAFDVVARWKLFTASSAVDALAKADHHRPDAILIDGEIAERDAIALAENLSQDSVTRGIPMVLLTQRAESETPVAHSGLHPAIVGTVKESAHPRKLVIEVTHMLGWQAQWMTDARSRQQTQAS
jgi:two-component system, OmpR family, phosphate regulon response regulator PhoB